MNEVTICLACSGFGCFYGDLKKECSFCDGRGNTTTNKEKENVRNARPLKKKKIKTGDE